MKSGDFSKPTENMDNTNRKKRGWPKGKKRRKSTKDENAPKRPISGYVRFMNERRDFLTKENQNMTFAEVTKLVGEEWSSMDQEQKSEYLNDAEKQRVNYLKQLEAYRKSEQYRSFLEKSKKLKSNTDEKSLTSTEQLSPVHPEVPIFTESFLDHNKTKESELHQLNKTNAEYEQQNDILEMHINNLRQAIIKLESDSSAQDLKNKSLNSKLLYFRELLVNTFSHISLPATSNFPTVDTIDTYMAEMCNILEKTPCEDTFASAVYEAMCNVSFETLNVYWNEQEHQTEL